MDLEHLIRLFHEQIPFNRHLDMRVDLLEHGRCRVRVPFAPHLVGDPWRPALHGGVLSTLADTAGGLAVFSTVDPDKMRVATVDLRIDYLRPGKLEDVLCDAHVVRVGNRVAVSAMTLHHGDPDYVTAEARGVYNLVRAGS